MKTRYAIQNYNKDNMARALAKDISISAKQSIEICNFLKHRSVKEAKKVLALVIEEKTPVPYKRFKMELPHRHGPLAAGQYPKKASQYILKLLDAVEANAQNKGLNTDALIITHMSANKASRPWHYGRKARRKMKRTHIEIVVEEKEKKQEKPKEKKHKNIK